jgi:hypothetical protein
MICWYSAVHMKAWDSLFYNDQEATTISITLLEELKLPLMCTLFIKSNLLIIEQDLILCELFSFWILYYHFKLKDNVDIFWMNY